MAEVRHITFLVGLPDNEQIAVGGYNAAGELVYSWSGNTDFPNHVQVPGFKNRKLAVLWNQMGPMRYGHPGLLVNCLNDPDTCGKSLAFAVRLVEQLHQRWPEIHVFNHPAAILRTTRDAIYQQFRHLPMLHMPKVLRLRPESVAHLLAQAAENSLNFPFLIRPCGSHQSAGLQRIRTAEDRALLERYAYDGREYYLTEFVDNPNADGSYSKGRLVIIGGTMHARHYMHSPHWLTDANAHDRHMIHHAKAKQAEAHFIEHYRDILHPTALTSLHQIAEALALDYLGIDFSPLPDGRLLIFEINAAQNAMSHINFTHYPHMRQAHARIVSGLNEHVRTLL